MPVEQLGFSHFYFLLRTYVSSNLNVTYEKSDDGEQVLRLKDPRPIIQDLVDRIRKWIKKNQVPKNVVYEDLEDYDLGNDLASNSEEEV